MRDPPRPDDDESDEEDENLYFIHDVVEQGAIERLRELLPPKTEGNSPQMQVLAAETCLLEKDDMGCLPVHIAVIYQRMECLLHLLRYSEALTAAMVRMKCADLNTPFVHLILRVGGINPQFATEVINELFSADSATVKDGDLRALLFEVLNAKDDEGNTALHICAMYDLDECFKTLLQFLARHVLPEVEEGLPAAANVPEVKALLGKGNRVGFRPLHTAVKFASLNVLRQLVEEANVNVNSVTTLRQSPVHVAALHGTDEALALLLKARSEVDLTLVDSYGSTALEVAIRNQFDGVVQLLSAEKEEKSEETTKSPVQTHFFFHPDSLRHLPMAYHRRGGPEPPPENPERVDTLVDPLFGILRSREFKQKHITWDHDIEKADIADVLRVHEYHYVQKIRRGCESLAPSAEQSQESRDAENGDGDEDEDDEESYKTFVLDPDTALSLRSYEAAMRAAGTVCRAVDQVVNGDCTNAFCVVRPPGHHVGPTGKKTCSNDPEGSHGFCVFNNVAIGAAYARSHYKRQGIHRIAILDFDVHHGNGTEEIIQQLVPSTAELRYETPYGEGKHIVHQYKPWRNESDAENVFFCSVHGYGHKDPQGEFSKEVQAAWFYPGSGESGVKGSPLIWNVGMEFCHAGSSVSRLKWRSAFRDEILPKLREFKPDLIFLSAGFDAHRKESVNWGYVSLLEQDYEWLTQHVKQVANSCCNGRLISVLEGGYNFHGRMVSPFARSVAAHARALVCPSREEWHEETIAMEAEHERAILEGYTRPAETQAIGIKKRVPTSGEEEPPVVTTTQSRSKRARKEVDYVALAAELAKQDAT
ncbi:hypothetical protein Poli38472_007186 [Pythium oligandrum]|uniref:Histone deacetylase domain-containing protein n=1 Tax=Pythium oligandrum TaxID=41045 RepID=A0A8K1FE48_PYTOL|nr:hypothetical protein Poli38472_007186 [Pythium oligandrum]|eukprot:TMW59041.1 hypothetical protein Poli38472_007186 [Pythium oligandrum]